MKARSPAFGVVNPILIIAVIVVNALAVVLPLNGRTTASISDSFASLFVPARYAFSIWSLIYACLLAFGVFQLLPRQRDNPFIGATDWWFALSCLANCGWLFAWHYGLYPLSLFIMFLLFLVLVIIYAGLHPAGRGTDTPALGTRLFVRLPFSIYLGWITVVLLANTSDVLSWANFAGLGAPNAAWAAALCIVVGAASLIMGAIFRDIACAAAVVWALIGIVEEQSSHPLIVTAAWVAVGMSAAGLAGGLIARRRRV